MVAYHRSGRLLAPRSGVPLPTIEEAGPPPPLEGYQAQLMEGRMTRMRTGPRWCTVHAELKYHYLPIGEDLSGGSSSGGRTIGPVRAGDGEE